MYLSIPGFTAKESLFRAKTEYNSYKINLNIGPITPAMNFQCFECLVRCCIRCSVNFCFAPCRVECGGVCGFS